MKLRIVAFFFTFFYLSAVWAQNSACPALPQQVVVYFGNGINTDQRSAERSMTLLSKNLGTTYNNKTIRYDTAYNATDGMALDLLQAVQQRGLQLDSEVVSWIDRLDLAPDWFVSWYQAEIERRAFMYTQELDQHVESYRRAIQSGQYVLVVSHSQGNFYVNEAKPVLSQRLSAEQMKRFAIYGVATPASSVGGAAAPYLTNHRDFISLVPGALPANFNLQSATGASADKVGRVSAHLFNGTYLSDDFNVKPVLLKGLRAELDKFEALPPVSCVDEVRAHLMGLGSGSYKGYERNDKGDEVQVSSSKVGKNGIVSAQGKGLGFDASGMLVQLNNASTSLDVTHPNVGLTFISATNDTDMSFLAVRREEDASDGQTQAGGSWSKAGQFKNVSVAASGMVVNTSPTIVAPNSQRADAPPPLVGEIVTNAMRILVGPKRLRFEAGECYSWASPKRLPAVEIEFSASGILINDLQVLSLDAFGPSIGLLALQRNLNSGIGRFSALDDYLPRLSSIYRSDSKVVFSADSLRGLNIFTYADAVNGMRCVKK